MLWVCFKVNSLFHLWVCKLLSVPCLPGNSESGSTLSVLSGRHDYKMSCSSSVVIVALGKLLYHCKAVNFPWPGGCPVLVCHESRNLVLYLLTHCGLIIVTLFFVILLTIFLWINFLQWKCLNLYFISNFKSPVDDKSVTHWGRVTHICVSKLAIIGSDNGLSPERRQAIIWTNGGILLIWPLGTNFSEISINFHTFSFKKIHFKMSSGKWRPFCLGLNVLKSPLILVMVWHWAGNKLLPEPMVTKSAMPFYITRPQMVKSASLLMCLWSMLTHWDQVMHICVSNLTIIGSDNGLSPERHQAII